VVLASQRCSELQLLQEHGEHLEAYHLPATQAQVTGKPYPATAKYDQYG
jgi:hypothetical protein